MTDNIIIFKGCEKELLKKIESHLRAIMADSHEDREYKLYFSGGFEPVTTDFSDQSRI